MDFGDNTTKIIIAVIAVITALLAVGFTINYKKNKKSGGVKINHSKIKGDVAGRDIRK